MAHRHDPARGDRGRVLRSLGMSGVARHEPPQSASNSEHRRGHPDAQTVRGVYGSRTQGIVSCVQQKDSYVTTGAYAAGSQR